MGERTLEPLRGSPADQCLFALAYFDEPVYPRQIEQGLGLSRLTVRRGLQMLLMLGFASRSARTKEGRLWSLTQAGIVLAARFTPTRD